ncbi:MAG: polysaccharide biosynthesis/export family protein, partial [Alistipes sp.]
MKKFIILLAVVLLCVETGLAQKIPDTQAIEYAKECYAQEMPIEQAVRVLQSKGVSIEQMKRLKTQYENGTLDVTDPSKKSDKERTNSSMTRTQSAKKNEKDASMDSLAMETTEYDKQKKESDEAKKPVMTKQDSLNRIYGHDIFQNKKLTFEPNLQLATPTNYVVGAGDELGIAIFGSSEVDLSQTVTPEGRIYVDGLGPVSIKGLTIEQVRTKLRRD